MIPDNVLLLFSITLHYSYAVTSFALGGVTRVAISTPKFLNLFYFYRSTRLGMQLQIRRIHESSIEIANILQEHGV